MVAPAPALSGSGRTFSGSGPGRKLVGFQLSFNTALSMSVAENVGNYRVTQPGLTKRSKPTLVHVKAAQYNSGNNTVTLTLGKFNAKKPLTLTIIGLTGASGTPAATIVTKL
jgi:hypothetical protein